MSALRRTALRDLAAFRNRSAATRQPPRLLGFVRAICHHNADPECWHMVFVRELVVRRGDWSAVAKDECAEGCEEEICKVHYAGRVSIAQM